MKLNPVSILLPVRNGLKFLDKAKESLNQNCSNTDEILIINDGSDDGSENYLKKWKSEDKRVSVIQGGGNGLVNALNLGLKAANNNWIARVDVDDTYSPERLRIQKQLITDDVVAIFSDYKFVGIQGANLGVIPSAIFAPAVSISLISSQRTPHPSVMFNRNAVLSVGGYRINDFPAEDLSLWLRLSRVGELTSAPSILLNYSLSPGSISLTNRESMHKKKKQLITEIGVNESDVSKLLNNWEDYFYKYESFEYATQRKILLTKEINLIYKSRSGDKRELVKLYKNLIFSANSYREIAQLAFEKNRRNRYRTQIQ